MKLRNWQTLICWVSAFLGSLLLLDIPEFTERFAILEGLGKIGALGTLILDF